MSAGPWLVEKCQTFGGRYYWAVWKRDPEVYGGRRYLPSASRTDRKRFYDEAKAAEKASKLNSTAAQAATDKKG